MAAERAREGAAVAQAGLTQRSLAEITLGVAVDEVVAGAIPHMAINRWPLCCGVARRSPDPPASRRARCGLCGGGGGGGGVPLPRCPSSTRAVQINVSARCQSAAGGTHDG
jgi:hypothetical protein